MSKHLNRFRVAINFLLQEFACPCCKTVKLEPELVLKLQALRFRLGTSIVVTSGYRCLKHNKEVGGRENSRHLSGRAADIEVKSVFDAEMIALSKEMGFTFCYHIPDSFAYHLDIGDDKL